MWGLYQTALDVKDWLTDASRLPMSELLLQGQHEYLKPMSCVLPCWMVPNFATSSSWM